MNIKLNNNKKRPRDLEMHLITPRITPLKLQDWSESSKKFLMDAFNLSDVTDIYSLDPPEMTEKNRDIIGRAYLFMHSNVTQTMDRFPDVQKAQDNYYNAIVKLCSLTIRERELIIIRTTWLNRSEYAFANHAALWVTSGLNAEEITCIIVGPDAPEWNPKESLLLQVTDDLYEKAFISDNLWIQLSELYNADQIVGIVFLVGLYTLVSIYTNNFGVQVETGRSNSFGQFSANLRQRNEKMEREGGIVFPVLLIKMKDLYRKALNNYSSENVAQSVRKRLTNPRITPREIGDWSEQFEKDIIETFNLSKIDDIKSTEFPGLTEKTRQIVGRIFMNVSRTLDKFPELHEANNNYQNSINKLNDLPRRERELLIIRTAWLNRAEYVFTTHAGIGIWISELNEEEINMIIEGSTASGWNDKDILLLKIADILYEKSFISDNLWGKLRKQYNLNQIAGIFFLIGYYTIMSMVTNSLGIQMEGDVYTGLGEFSAEYIRFLEKQERDGEKTLRMFRKSMNKLFLDAVNSI